MPIHIERVRDIDEARPSDVFEVSVTGGGFRYFMACPRCGKLSDLPHRVEVHEDGTVSLWNPMGGSRSFVCGHGCGFDKDIDRGQWK